jgi:magnesium-transporting ATPase (P-type)
MSLEQFNSHQQDVRSRTDSLAQAVFVLSGGALSISIGIFSNNKNIPECAASILKLSWWSLTTTIISLVIMLFIVIGRDYFFGERWRKQLDGKVESANVNNTVVDIFIWLFALISLVSFMVGYIGLAYAASSVLGSA